MGPLVAAAADRAPTGIRFSSQATPCELANNGVDSATTVSRLFSRRVQLQDATSGGEDATLRHSHYQGSGRGGLTGSFGCPTRLTLKMPDVESIALSVPSGLCAARKGNHLVVLKG